MSKAIKITSNVFSKREIVALHFATALVATRDKLPDHPRSTNAATMRDAFAFADAFLDPDHRRPRKGPCN